MIAKPEQLFDRDREWASLAAFSRQRGTEAMLGVVSGRRRQGKTYLLSSLTDAVGGFYFGATEATQAEALRSFGEALGEFRRAGAPLTMSDWSSAVGYLFDAAVDEPLTAVLDEFPYLVKSSPELPSLLQRELDASAGGRRPSRLRLLLCGSAMSVMGGLLAGSAPLRGRASLELVVRPLTYREAARFWGITDPRLAVLVNAIVGGTPAYRRQFVRNDAPSGIGDFDDWVVRTVLNPEMPLFREARYLLAEEPDVRDAALYHSVLAAIANGNSTWGGIANYVGRQSAQIAHPISVLEDCGLVAREPDVLRAGRSHYRITEPLITFYQSIMRPAWTRLELGHGPRVWEESSQRFLSQVVGPHFEQLCRSYAMTEGATVFGEPPSEVGAGAVNDPAAKRQLQIDVAVLGAPDAGTPRRVVSLGEAKWGKVMGLKHLDRLRRARDLLGARGFAVEDAVLACYSAAGFDDDLRAEASQGGVALIDLDQLYGDLSDKA